jgi:hypothetical protein
MAPPSRGSPTGTSRIRVLALRGLLASAYRTLRPRAPATAAGVEHADSAGVARVPVARKRRLPDAHQVSP